MATPETSAGSFSILRAMRFTVLAFAAALPLATALAASEPSTAAPPPSGPDPYLETLRAAGVPPVDFTVAALDSVDLVIFDDALHPAVEPFAFYQQLVRDPRFAARARYVFLEAVPMNQQPALDAYLASDPEDRALLYPAFQDDFGGGGWPFQTYFDLLHAVWEVNHDLPAHRRLAVVGVGSPCSWACIRTSRDLELFRESLDAYDYQMYVNIRRHLDNFGSGRRGIFLTNTRHAYTGIRHADGSFYWNCGTFFRQWHPGKTLSVRCHGPQLAILSRRKDDPSRPRTTEGLEKIEYRFIRVEDGAWDRAFAANDDRPAALRIAGTPFGRAPYLGNHMLDVAPGTTMADAYDALVYLGPVDRWRKSAMTAELYTSEFRAELGRRYQVMYSAEELAEREKAAGVTTIADLVAHETMAEPETVLPQAAGLPPLAAPASPPRLAPPGPRR